ncbi:M20/M25/M40 family metallo-hydrolase [Bacteroidota bacterium]
MDLDTCHKLAIQLIRELISIPSVSREEKDAADRVEGFLGEHGHKALRRGNNVWVRHHVSDDLPTILLNSHLDTVKPVEGWTRDPYSPEMEEFRIYGLGSNDAGGALVSLMVTFLYYSEQEKLPYNLVFASSAEEENSGENGVSSILGELGRIDLGIVGEPTSCKMAVAEKGLLVLDCISKGSSAHAASTMGTNAIYEAMKDLEWFRNYQFEKSSKWLGDVSMQVTQIEAGTQHNVVPDACRFVADVRTNECYTNESVFEIIKENVKSAVKARSFRLTPSFIPETHPLVLRGLGLGLEAYGSLTLSDQSLMPFTSLKIGPGDWIRSHTADEFITIDEIKQGIITYIQLLKDLKLQ